jgi:putative flippase GtrA
VTRAVALRSLLADPRAQAWLLVLRFGLVGLLNTAFGYAVFAVFVLLGTGATVALVISTLTGAAFNFHTARRLVFRSSGRAVRFFALYAGALALNWVALRLLHHTGLSDLAAQAILVLPMATLLFVGQKSLVFAEPRGGS